jgi:AcrR family transcriptional regulator
VFPLTDVLLLGREAPGGRRDQNKMRTRQRLNEAAITLFAEQGYDSTGVADIARAAGVSLRTFFRYFASKEDVLFAQGFDLSGFLRAISEQPPDLPALTAVRLAYSQQEPLSAAEVELVLLFQQAMSTTAALQGRFLRLQHNFREQVAAALARRNGRRVANREDLVAATVAQALLEVATREWTSTMGKRRASTIVDDVFGVLEAVLQGPG